MAEKMASDINRDKWGMQFIIGRVMISCHRPLKGHFALISDIAYHYIYQPLMPNACLINALRNLA